MEWDSFDLNDHKSQACVYNCIIGYTGRMSATKTLLTAEEFDNYPFEEDKRYELDEGELIEMTRPGYLHNRILGILFVALSNYFRQNPIGETPSFPENPVVRCHRPFGVHPMSL